MAIQFARIEHVQRSAGAKACCKGAYNARTIIKDEKTNVIYNFQNRGDDVYHEILLPDHVDKKFKNTAVLMNEVERLEKRKDSVLLKDIVLALPDDKELTLEDRIIITHRLIEKREWIKEGLAVQVDIHEPHEGEKNWHAHLLVTTRRFTEDGKGLSTKKAVDLEPKIVGGKYRIVIKEDQQIHEDLKEIINDYFKGLGLENRVDSIGINPQEHIGPVRMRSVLNQAMDRNEERRIAEIEHLSNGSAVLDKVTRHTSVFSRGDLMRAAKCVPDIEVRERLVEDALSDKSVVALFRQDNSKTQYFTTAEIRAEEEKVLRLSGYVANLSNVFMSSDKSSLKRTGELVGSAIGSLSGEQHIALTELITSNSALRILRGRAGVGKSHVLGQVALIARASNINVIGLAPTHKAKEALRASGFEHTDTIKGMLFKLANGRFSLPKNSLLVVDEAGMIGNDDYQELLRVAATRKCNVILSGDERQLASVQRGGMFEIFAGIYGSSTILDIKRQQASWGKSVAMAFSKGDVGSGIAILTEANRINRQATNIFSMEALLADWHKSSELAGDRLILAVKNKDVAALNHGARQYLKADGKLTGLEVEVSGNHYMRGDRILIQKTNKELGVVNGDLAEILEVTKDRFVISMQNTENVRNADNSNNSDNTKIIEFNPSEYQGFRHGYATTVFKSQGASIKDVYVFHDGFAGLRNSYVALSRHISELKLYVNSSTTPSLEALIKQLSYDPERGSSLNLLTAKELEDRALNTKFTNHQNMAVRAVNSAIDFIGKAATKMKDKYLPSSEYYNYKEPTVKTEAPSYTIDRIYEQSQNIGFESQAYEERLVVGGNISIVNNTLNTSGSNNSITNALADNGTNSDTHAPKTSLSAKDRFYANADYARNKAQRTADLQAGWDKETEILRKESCICAERIATDLLGNPNKKLSNARELRFGDSGKIAVHISGEKAGTWYNFHEGKGGDIFALVQDTKGCDFKGAADYLRQSLGIAPTIGNSIINSHLQLVHDHANSNITAKYIKDKQLEERGDKQKQDLVNKLVQRSKDITENSVAFRYLAGARGIGCTLGNDIKTAGVYSLEKNRYLPALIAYARDEQGNITGGQQILLKASGLKADITTPKKSFGKISGSFVNLSDSSYNNNKGNTKNDFDNYIKNNQIAYGLQDKITIIAEGLETALSVKQALGHNHNYLPTNSKILCSLGINNISNFQPSKGEKIIIAADNDGEHSVTDKTINSGKITLESRGAYVEIVRPLKEGDFNDLLLSSGEQSIQDTFKTAINKHLAITVNQYLAACNKTTDIIKLSNQERENLTYIQKYNLPEKTIVEAYRHGGNKGTIALEQSRKSLEFAANCYKQNKNILLEAKHFGYALSEANTTKAMIGMSYEETNSFCEKIRDSSLSEYLNTHLRDFTNQKLSNYKLEKLKPIIVSEQRFLKETYESLSLPIDKYRSNYALYSKLQAAEIAATQPEILNKVFSLADSLLKEHVVSELDVCRDMLSSVNTKSINQKLEIASAIKKQFRQPSIQAEARLKSTSPELALTEIQKEQNMLADLHGNIKYFSHNKELISKVELAYTQRENRDFDKLEVIAQKSLETGTETKETLLKKLQHTTDLKETYNKLDQAIEVHQINSRSFALNNQISKSQTADDILKAIEEKESFLMNLDKNIKYPELQEKLLELGKLVKISHSQQVPEKLSMLVGQVLLLGTCSERSIVDELKDTKNIEKTCQKFEVAIDVQRINKYLLKLDTQKQEAKTLDKVMTNIKQEQEFLAGLHSNIKHPECHSDNLINSIKNAHDNIRTGNFDKLSKFVTFLEKNTNDHTAIISTLKSTNGLTETHETLLKSYQAKCINTINDKISILDAGKTITLDSKKFDSSIKFLDYLTKTRTHEYFPCKEVQKIQSKAIENHKQLELSKSKGLEMEL